MQVHYQITEKDWQLAQAEVCAQCRILARSSWLARATWWAGFVLLVVSGAASVNMFQKYPGVISSDFSLVFLAAIVGFTCFFVSYKAANRTIQSAVLAAMGPFPLEHQITLDDSHVDVQNRSARSIYPWSSFSAVRETDSLVMLVVRPAAVLPIPTSAFSSPSAREAFVALAKTRVGP